MIETRVHPLKVAPVDLLNALHEQPGFFMLESSMPHPQRGRYTFIGCHPFFVAEGHDVLAFERLQKRYDLYQGEKSALTPFPAGIAGFLSYDFGLKFENVKSRHGLHAGVPGFSFGFYDRVITIDHVEKKLIITSTGWPETKSLPQQKRATARIQEVEAVLAAVRQPLGGIKTSSFSTATDSTRTMPRPMSNFTQSGYCNAVQKVLDYIKKGDIYQANVAQEFSYTLPHPINAAQLYTVLRDFSPSCFGGFWNGGRFQIVSSSPEMFLTLQDGVVKTRPMKGTRPRGENPEQDRRNHEELQHDSKEQAELLMVTDLERNDLGRVCDFGSIKVEQIREIEEYRTVYQATATVSGQLAPRKNAFDVIEYCFPSGSITGCPKIRSMEIIDELERSARGIYTGALGYISFSGDMAFNVLIRTMLISGQNVSFHAGSGIVADSHPEREYEETLVKTQALRESLRSLL